MLVGLTGLLAFMLFFCAATVNALVISLLMSLAAAGGFLALFLACVTGIYVGALLVAVCAVSTITFITIFAVLMTTGNLLTRKRRNFHGKREEEKTLNGSPS